MAQLTLFGGRNVRKGEHFKGVGCEKIFIQLYLFVILKGLVVSDGGPLAADPGIRLIMAGY